MFTVRIRILAAAMLSLIVLPGRAHADPARAWAAARAGLPADTKLVVGIDVAAAQKTQLFATLFPKLRDRPDVAAAFDAIKTSCKLDPLAIVQGAVLAVRTDDDNNALYLAIAGADRAKLTACMQTAGKAGASGDTVAVENEGNITTFRKGSETRALGWIGKDVVVIAKDKAALTLWMGGKGAFARSALGKALAKVNTAATLWGAGEGKKELQPGTTAQGGYGTVTVAGGKVVADLHAVLETPAQAAAAAMQATQQLEIARTGAALAPELAGLLGGISVLAEKDQVRIRANVTESAVLGALAMAGSLGMDAP
jgi:hypothetical protein